MIGDRQSTLRFIRLDMLVPENCYERILAQIQKQKHRTLKINRPNW